jgi:hypothetical protein
MNPHIRENYFIWTEVFNVGEVSRPMVESFIQHHQNLQLNIFGTQKDLETLPSNPCLRKIVFPRTGEPPRSGDVIIPSKSRYLASEEYILRGYEEGHLGTARLWTWIISNVKSHGLIHLDSDVIMFDNLVADLIIALEQGAAVVGGRRPYLFNRNMRDDVRSRKDVVRTDAFGFVPQFIKPKRYSDLVRKIRGFALPTELPVIDFFDPISFEIMSNGGEFQFLGSDLVGGFDSEGRKSNIFSMLNDRSDDLLIDIGAKMMHFSSVGSGLFYSKRLPDPQVVPHTYVNYALRRYRLFEAAFISENVHALAETLASSFEDAEKFEAFLKFLKQIKSNRYRLLPEATVELIRALKDK